LLVLYKVNEIAYSYVKQFHNGFTGKLCRPGSSQLGTDRSDAFIFQRFLHIAKIGQANNGQ